jgi:hypothetical protein
MLRLLPHLLPHLLLLAGLVAAAEGQAQTMYRCGSVYQDRPCDAGKKGRAVGSTGTAAPAAATVDTHCAQRGRASNKIVWAREGGATEERLLSEAGSAAERRLIQDVYRRPGAASTVQAAVEADCIAEKQREEQDAALAIAAALKARREGGAAPAHAGAFQEPDLKAQEQAAKVAAQQRAEYEAQQKNRQCASYNQDMERLRRSQRAGGSVRTMESLNDEVRSLRDQMSRAGC